ncbi:putative toxin-antitoxin system toxin component, PIN family [Candidatus Woesearchaeota archaeon]|nr:putative toxin-antitoxin system toxin component, PIN family [Candidatus Woesearchaeota archaeon]
MGTKKVVVDTNVLISALGWEGKPGNILQMVVENKRELIISHQQMKELERVLSYPKLVFLQDGKERFLNLLLNIGTLVETTGTMKVIQEDPTDNILLEAAIMGEAEIIITGDAHLLKLKNYRGVSILTPAQFLDLVH